MEDFIKHINPNLFASIHFIFSFLICYLLIPKLIGVLNFVGLMDHPIERSSHYKKTPNLGGVAFYITLIMSIFFLQTYDTSHISINIITALSILFITGLKDDLMVLSYKAKLMAETTAIFFLVLHPDLHSINWNGLFHIEAIPNWLNYVAPYIILLGTINAYNLIDGIDGLAGMQGVLIFGVFAFIFYQLELSFYFLIAIVGVAFLIAFLRYNLSKKDKIFMGDTGTMIVGVLIGILSLRLLGIQSEQLHTLDIKLNSLGLFFLVLLFIPFLDMFRVMTIRCIQGRNIFKPDKNHAHHIFIQLGWSHLKTSLFLTFYSSSIILLFYLLNKVVSISYMMVILLLIGSLTLVALSYLNKNKKQIKESLS